MRSPWTVVEAGAADAHQLALPHDGQVPMLPVGQLTPLCWGHGPDLSSKKSRSTLSWPICWYRRAIRASLFLFFCSLPLLVPLPWSNMTAAPSTQGLLPSLNLVGVDLEPGGQLGHRLLRPSLTQCNFRIEGRAVLSPLSGHFPLLLDSRRCPQFRSRIPT